MELKLECGRIAYSISANDGKRLFLLLWPHNRGFQKGWICLPMPLWEAYDYIWEEDCYLIATNKILSIEEMLTHPSELVRENALNQELNKNAS